MKGVVFTEFIEFAEGVFDIERVERAIHACRLPSGGAYIATGTYEPSELEALLQALDDGTRRAKDELLVEFGRHLFARLEKLHPKLFAPYSDAFTFLAHVDDCIHLEVRKLHAGAETPRVRVAARSRASLTLLYESPRKLSALALGLIQGCAAHFGEQLAIEVTDLSGGEGTLVRFVLERVQR